MKNARSKKIKELKRTKRSKRMKESNSMRNKVIVFMVLIFVFCSTLFAVQKENRVVIKGLRPMSMGGAFTAISDDENAFFYNPAGITQRNGYLLQILSIDAADATSGIDNIRTDRSSDTLSDEDNKEIIDELKKQILSSRPNLFASATIGFITSPMPVEENYLSFGLGVFAYTHISAKFTPSVLLENEVTTIEILPIAFKISSLEAIKMPGSLSLGVNFKDMRRSKLKLTVNNNVHKGTTFNGKSFGIDVGAIYHLNPSLNFGINVADIYNYYYHKVVEPSESNYAAKIAPELNIGVSYYPEKFYYWPDKYLHTNDRLALAFDLTDLTNTDLTNFDKPFFETLLKKTHIGAEYKYDPFVIRAGFNSGYPTIGCAIGTNVFQLEYAFYGQERGTQAGRDPEWFHRIKFSIKLGNRKGKLYGKKKETLILQEEASNTTNRNASKTRKFGNNGGKLYGKKKETLILQEEASKTTNRNASKTRKFGNNEGKLYGKKKITRRSL
jgi:hypothetical protein